MGIPIGMWLWLWVAQVSSEESEPACLPVAGEDCYRLLRRPQPALGAVIWCGRSHGRLLHTWNQQIQDALRDRLDDRSKTWIGAAAKALPEVSHPGKGESGAGAQRPNSSTAEEGEECDQKHFFICQSGACDKASLPHASFHLLQPRGLNVTFPSSSALEPVLSQHPQVQVQVASFAFNPFRHLDGKPIKRTASIALMASEESIGVHNLAEEIEIGLSAEASAEAPHTHLTGNVRNFDIVVNITSVEDALLVSVESSTVVQITLHLGLQPEPNKNSSLLNTTLPSSGWQEEGTCTWVIPPEELQHHGLGTYYISAEVAPLSQGPWNLSIHTIISGCYYWSSQHQAWRSDGCRVGSQSTLHSTQCLCNHLTFFGCVALVLPHLIDLHNTAKLLSTVGQNPSGLALLSSLLLGYGAALVWARWRQRTDVKKVKVTILADNEATACFPYLVQVFTGYRRGAGTSAKVILTLYGAEGRSEPHLLQHPQGPSFERGGRDAFLLATQKSLGNLHAILHGPARKWHFLCDSWLAADLDDGHVDKVFAAASERDLLSFRYQFWSGLVDKLTQEHLWLSVVTCSPWSPFTRVQRLSCCLALLCCTFLINIMFWRKEAGSRRPFMVTWHELLVSVETAIFLMPVSLLISHIFQLVQPPAPKPPAASPELLQTRSVSQHQPLAMDKFPGTSEQVPELVAALCDLIESHLQHQKDLEGPPQERRFNLHSYLSHVLDDLGTQLSSLDLCSFPNPYDHLHAVDQLRRVQQHLEQHPTGPRSELSSFPLEDPEKERPPFSHCLPRRFSFACWLTVGSISLVSAFFTVLYSLEMSRDEAGHWAVNILLSVLQNIFVMQPLKVLALTFLFSLLHKRELWKEKGQEQQLWWALGLVTGNSSSPNPPPCASICSGCKIQQDKLYTERSPNEFYFNNSLQRTFTSHLEDILTPEELYGWIRVILLPGLHGNSEGEQACSRDKGGLALQWASEAGWLSWGCWGGRRRKGVPSPWEPALLAASMLDPVPVSVAGALFTSQHHCSFHLHSPPPNIWLPESSLLLPWGQQGRQLKQQKWKYFSSKRNLLDASTILISVAAIGLYRRLSHTLKQNSLHTSGRFISFYEMVEVDSALTYLIAFLVALTTIKLWNLLRLNPRMHLITQTLQKAWDEVLGFLLTLLVLLVGYAIVCNLMFGWSVDDYKTFFHSAVTIVGLLIGIFNYEEVIAVDPVFGAVLIVTSVISMVFVIINLFVSALLTTFSREMKAAKESMLQLIQLKISTLFGIKKQPPFPAASQKEPQD
uniref:Polycystin 1 like 3, transient receptor potential channel interacting n=1 Tax=Podarcis muralis TaxID=64176 RepID=A0A670ILC9_PODMU